MKTKSISREELDAALCLRDLSDPSQGPHAMQSLLCLIHETLESNWSCQKLIYRACPVVTVRENYDELGYPKEGIARNARYTRYISQSALLRTQITASIPILLRSLSCNPPNDLLLVCPGLVYRRDVIDRLHVGEPHQLDIWRIKKGKLKTDDLHSMIGAVVEAALPGRAYRTISANHPYTVGGLQIDVEIKGQWIEIGECGLADPELLQRSGLDPREISGLAMGLGLDRLLMLRKGIDDIRLLRATDPRVIKQMSDLEKYRPVSKQPAITRDLSICVNNELDAEQLGDRVRAALGEHLEGLETLEVLSETPYDHLPESARERMGVQQGQKNLLIRLVIRHPTRTLTAEEANQIRDQVYMNIHEGLKKELTT